MKKKEISEILSKICVSQPYFNFEEIMQNGDELQAVIIAEQENLEGSKLPMGEVMRHLAILGSCAYAINQPQKQYYLAKEGVGTANTYEIKGDLIATAKVVGANKRDLIVNAKAFCSETKKEIYNTEIFYSILTERVFGKFFGSNTQSYEIDKKAYKKNSDGFKITFTSSQCSGHFDNCPLVPIAFLNHQITSLICQQENQKFIFKSFDAKFLKMMIPNKEIEIKLKKTARGWFATAEQQGVVCNELFLNLF